MADLHPTRRGRLAGQMEWERQYQALLMTAEEAAELVPLDGVVACTGGTNWPQKFDKALAARLLRENGHVEVASQFCLQPAALLAPECREHVRYCSNFFSGERKLTAQGNIAFAPTNLSQSGNWLAAREPQVVVVVCSTPNEQGWMSRSLWGAHVTRQVLEAPGVRLIAEVNPNLPFLHSDGDGHMMLHVSEVDGIVEDDFLPMELPAAPSNADDEEIAGFIADLVPDGACVQFGLGGLANAVGTHLANAGKKDLGFHSEVMSSCVIDLVEKGIITGARKQSYPGRCVASFVVGDRKLWKFAADNPVLCMKEISWTNDPRILSQNDNVVSINNAMEIDLTGQVNAETVGARQYSGTGGQLEWVIGSQWSRGGKSILALKSAYRDKNGQLCSKILPTLAPGSVVTTPRTFVQYVVTEYGVADLKYKTALERARALIAIAHPDFREELRRHLPL